MAGWKRGTFGLYARFGGERRERGEAAGVVKRCRNGI